MPVKACFVYPWATVGGIERVLLNRAIAFKFLAGDAVEMDVYFLRDAGALQPFRQAITAYKLEAQLRITASLDERRYDVISLIDCPQAFFLCKARKLPYLVECHTTYPGSRAYLKKLDSLCKGILAPSRYFADLIASEVPVVAPPVRMLRNFVPWDAGPDARTEALALPAWSRLPLLFFGRLDDLKDPRALLDAFAVLEKKHPGRFMLVLCGPESPEVAIEEGLRRRGIRHAAVMLPAVGFAAASRLLLAMADAGGIFVSPSRSESFGLSAAEAISCGLPVVLSDIQPHRALVDNNPFFLYPRGGHERLAERIAWLADHRAEAKNALAPLRNNLAARAFIEDWQALLSHHPTPAIN
jgi:glycosyltransferase involved in cell wall biosynthesis